MTDYTSNPRIEQTAKRLANAFLVAAGLGCAAALAYVFYHYQWIQDRRFADPASGWFSYGLPGLLAGFFFGALRLGDSRKTKIAFVSIVFWACLGIGELFLEIRAYIANHWPSEVTEGPEAGSRRAKIAERLGVAFDRRSLLTVIEDLRQAGVDAVPASSPQHFQKENPNGPPTWNVDGHQIFPLGGIANKTTVLCNENGAYTIYDSDEHGFHNPRGIWDRHRLDIAAVGDSFTHGNCVPSERNFMALIRKSHPATLNLGVQGNGPLSELGSVMEYLPQLRPKLVLWFYFEGNDPADLANERNNPVLMQYLEGASPQHLLSRQAEIDERIRENVDRLAAEAVARRRKGPSPLMKLMNSAVRFSTLSLLRQHLRLIYGEYFQAPTRQPAEVDPELLALFRRILLQVKNIVDGWEGTLYFVYLPGLERYAHPERAVKNRDAVLQMVKELTIPLVDLHPAFQAHPDHLSLFPFRGVGHYTEAGHALVAQTVLEFIDRDRQVSANPLR